MISARIDFSNPHDSAGPRLRHAFGQPSRVLVAHALAEVRPLLDAVQAAAAQGLWCVGYLSYEAAPAFDAALTVHAAVGPLAWFALYDEALPWPSDEQAATASVNVDWQASCTRPVFDAAFTHIQKAITQGDLYQLNFTAPVLGHLQAQPDDTAAQVLFGALQRAQPGGYAAYLDTGDEQLLSVSPELFFDWRDGQLLTRPMKGTAARGCTPETDAAQAAQLLQGLPVFFQRVDEAYQQSDRDLGELQPLRQPGFVARVRQLPAQRRQQEIRRDEHCAC